MENNVGYVQEVQEKKGSVITGFIGALLGAAIGAVLWTLIGMMGYIASIVGFVIAFLSDKGYDLFKGRQGTVKMIVLILCVVLAVGAGTVGTYVWLIHDEYNTQLSELTEIEKKYYVIATEAEFMRDMLSDSEIQGGMLKDAGMGLLFGILGAFGLIKSAKDGKKKQTTTDVSAAAVTSIEDTLEMAKVNQDEEAAG